MANSEKEHEGKEWIKTSVFEVASRLWPTLRRYRGRFSWGAVLILLSTAVEVITPVLIGKSVDAAVAGPALRSVLITYCGIYFLAIALKAILESLQAFVIQTTGEAVTHDLRSLLFAKIQSLPVAYFDQNPTGRLLTRVVNDIKSLSELFTASISVLALDFMIIAGTLVAMFWVEWRLAGAVLFTFPLVLLSIRYFGNRLAIVYRNVRGRLSEINSFLGENIGAISTIQRLAAESEREAKFTEIVARHQEAQMESISVFAWVQPITNVLNGVSTATLVLLGGYWVLQGRLSVGMVVAFFGYLRNLFQPVRDLVEKYNTFLSAMVSAERVSSILQEPSELPLARVMEVPESSRSKIWEESPPATSIRFENVTFHYPLRQLAAIEDVNLDLPQGKSLAVVGATGSGKSTLIRLLLRFYEPTSGRITFGGKALEDWDKQDLRRQIGVIHQEIYLFQGSVRDNLTLGRENFHEDYLRSQCERAQLWPFIKDRGGLDMPVLEGGTNFSIGEKQLISFARILVFDTPVLVLDEATSSVDRLLEKRLMEAVRETLSGRTSIVIAHRLSTIKRCDALVVLEKGRVAETGTYDGLLEACGLFAQFHELHNRA